MFSSVASSPDHAALDALCTTLAARANATADEGPWRSGAFAMLADSGLLAGFIPQASGGTGASEIALLEALVAVAERCLTTALARGTATTTVGIAHLTTSRRHLGRPALAAVRKGNGWRLDGLCPWVTGADSSDTIVTGAIDDAGEQRFFVVRAAQALLTATKGAGFVAGHPAERLVREAHFFLVWSCPQTVAGITLCELSRSEM